MRRSKARVLILGRSIIASIIRSFFFFLILCWGFIDLYATTDAEAKTFYLDGQLTFNCLSGTYGIANRDCTGTDGDAYHTLQDAIDNLGGGDTLVVRGGIYIPDSTHSYNSALAIILGGSPTQHTVVRNFAGELPVICTEVGKC